MAAKDRTARTSKKRKDNAGSEYKRHNTKTPKVDSFESSKSPKQLERELKHVKPTFEKATSGGVKKLPLEKKERRVRAKELAEARKKKRKRHYTLEQEIASLWEKMRRHDISKEDRSKLISEALEKMKGRIPEIAGSHISSRVLQTCVKYCSQAERDAVFTELQPHFLNLSCNTYAVHLLKKMLDNVSKKHLALCISSLRGHVASLLRHMVGSVVVEHAYQLGNAAQKQELLLELYSPELQLFKDLVPTKGERLIDIISKLGLQKSSVIRHMTSVIQPILEKGIVDHSIIHRLLVEYLSIADKTSAADIIQQLSGPLLVRMIHTRDGSRLGIMCIKHGNAKERKKVIKGMKCHIGKIAHDQCGSMVLVSILSIVDDTKLVAKVLIRELQGTLKELVSDKNGRRPLLQLLHPNSTRYFGPEDKALLELVAPSLCGMTGKAEAANEANVSKNEESLDLNKYEQEGTPSKIDELSNSERGEGGKKDPLLRRQELLLKSGLAQSLIDVCIENAEEFLKSNFGKELMYEVVTGGSDGILHPILDAKLEELHETIASLASNSDTEDLQGDEHILKNFHSSRTVRRMVLDCPNFASILWRKALKGKCELWAQGHSAKVICAFLETPNIELRETATEELQPLLANGLLKVPQSKQPAKDD